MTAPYQIWKDVNRKPFQFHDGSVERTVDVVPILEKRQKASFSPTQLRDDYRMVVDATRVSPTSPTDQARARIARTRIARPIRAAFDLAEPSDGKVPGVTDDKCFELFVGFCDHLNELAVGASNL